LSLASGFGAAINLTNVAAGIGGFVIHGQDANDFSGFSVASAGDINGDGFGDLIIGAELGDAARNAKLDAGDSYVVFGKASGFGAAIDLTNIAAGIGGFVINGQDAGDQSGWSVASAGDVNGDGFGDLIVGAVYGDARGNAKSNAGDSYVIFGKASSFGAAINLTNVAAGIGGFEIYGQDAQDRSGLSVASAGDIDGDGFGDLIIGAPRADAAGNAKAYAGDSYVVFGKASGFGAAIDLTDVAAGTGGFAINGQDAGDFSGFSVASAGDINGDGFGDLIIGAPYGRAAGNAKNFAGDSYVIFGKSSTPPTITANQIFLTEGGGVEAAGRIRVLADFSKAAYALQPWEALAGNPVINDKSLFASDAYQALLGQGWAPVNLKPTDAVNSTSIVGGQLVKNSVTMSNGFFTNGNAAALVARSADALVISFRGTNDNGSGNADDLGNSIHPDKDQWLHMRDHYALLQPLLTVIDRYVANSANGINSVYVTGHSLGGALAIQYLSTHAGTNYSATTFAAPGYVDTVDDQVIPYRYPDRTRVTHIEINGDLTPDLGMHGGRTIHFEGSNDAFYDTADNHSMDYYRQITKTVDPEAWTVILAQPGDTDPDVFIGAQIVGTDFIVDGLRSGTNAVANAGSDTLTDPQLFDYKVYYGGRGLDVLTGGSANEVFLGGADDDRISGGAGADSLVGGLGIDILIGGDGDDTYVVDELGDVVTELANEGNDTIQTALGSYSLASLANVENLVYTGAATFAGTGNALANNITGNNGNDTIDGGDGNDSLSGGLGFDSLVGGDGDDTLRGGDQADTLLGGEGNDYLSGGKGLDSLFGGNGNDTLLGLLCRHALWRRRLRLPGRRRWG
jgi:hypothetical protein